MSNSAPDQDPKQLLNVLAEIRSLISNRALELRRMYGAKTVQTSLELVSYTNGPRLEGYLDIGFGNDDAVCWSLDVLWDRECWKIDANLFRQSSDGQETVVDIPEETYSDFQEFISALKRIAGDLLALDIKEAGIGPWSVVSQGVHP